LTGWLDPSENATIHMDWIRKLYDNKAPYASMNPREAYVDLFFGFLLVKASMDLANDYILQSQ